MNEDFSNPLEPLDDDEMKSSVDKDRQQEMRQFANNMRTFRKDIKLALDDGESPKSIFDRLIETYGERYERFFSRAVAGTPSQATMDANKSVHQVLMGLLYAFILGFVYQQFRLIQSIEVTAFNYIVIGLMVAFLSFLARQMARFRGEVLYSLMIVMAFGVYYYFQEASKDYFEIWMYSLVILAFVIIGLAYYLKRKAFPNLKYGGPKRDANGDYIF